MYILQPPPPAFISGATHHGFQLYSASSCFPRLSPASFSVLSFQRAGKIPHAIYSSQFNNRFSIKTSFLLFSERLLSITLSQHMAQVILGTDMKNTQSICLRDSRFKWQEIERALLMKSEQVFKVIILFLGRPFTLEWVFGLTRQEVPSFLRSKVWELTGYQMPCGLIRPPVVFVCRNQLNVHILYGIILEGTSEQCKAL